MATVAGSFANSVRHYLVEIYPYDVGAASERILRFGDYELTTNGSESPANKHYQAMLETPFAYSAKMFQKQDALFGPVEADIGMVTIKINAIALISEYNYTFSQIRSLEYSKRRIVVKRGNLGDRIGDFVTIRDGLMAARPTFTDDLMTIKFSGVEEILKNPIQPTLYAGDNGISATAKEGKEELEGVPKILTIGTVTNLTPVEVNAVGQIFQVHDGPVKSITNFADNGSTSFTYDGDLTGTAFDTWSKVPAHWVSDKARGLLMTGSPLVGVLTCDVEGEYTGSVFPSSHAEIIAWLLEYAGVTSINSASFTAHDTADSAPAGVVIKSEISGQDLIGQLLVSCGSYGGENNAQEYVIGKVDSPAVTADHDLGSTVNDVSTQRITEPFWRMRFSYGPDEDDLTATARIGKPQGATQAGVISSALGSSDKNSPKAEDFGLSSDVVKGEVASPASFKSTYKGAVDGETRRTFYTTRSDASTELARQLAIFDSPLTFYKIATSIHDPDQIAIGDTVQFSWEPQSLTNVKIVVTAIDILVSERGNATTIWGFA